VTPNVTCSGVPSGTAAATCGRRCRHRGEIHPFPSTDIRIRTLRRDRTDGVTGELPSNGTSGTAATIAGSFQ